MKYCDRNEKKWEEESGQDRLLAFLYGHVVTRALLRPVVSPAVSAAGGRILNSRISAAAVKPFIRKNKIDMTQYEDRRFRSYNDFFTRKIREGKRPTAEGENVLISPCDGKLSVYPIESDSRFCIKNTEYTVAQLLKNRKLAARYEGGYAVIVRLTVDDYHHYCYAADGVKSRQIRIRGVLHTVNPAANDVYPIYKMNSREYCLIRTKNFGVLAAMEVGALMVGKICNYDAEGPVKRGEEKGRFEFGGSTVVLLIQKGKVQIDRDLLEHTRDGYETVVRMGERIGEAGQIREGSSVPEGQNQ